MKDSTNDVNGANMEGVIIGAPTPSNGKPPTLPRAYYMSPNMSLDERERLVQGGVNPDEYVVALCPSAAPPQMAQPAQGVEVFDPETGASGGVGYVFLVPVVLPVDIPQVATGIIGPDGKPAGQIRFEGPPTALCRVILPLATLSQEARNEYDAVCADMQATERAEDTNGTGK